VPELKRVVVVNGTAVGVGTTLSDALAASVEGQIPGGGGGGGNPPTGSVSQQVAALLDEALRHFTLADAALKAGDLATYQDELSQAQDLVSQAQDLAAQEAGGATSTPTANPTVSASASASP